MRKEKIMNFFKRYWTIMWLVAALASFFSVYSYAKYGESHNIVKRVIRTGKNYTNLFSSNYLTGSAPAHPKTQIEGYSENTVFDVEIWNYDRKHPTNYCHEDITYTLTAKLVYPSGESYVDHTSSTIDDVLADGDYIRLYSVSSVNGVTNRTLIGKLGYSTTDAEVTLSKTINNQMLLTENGSTANSYQVEFPSQFIDKNVYLFLEARPVASDLALETLGGYFYVKTQTVNLSVGWSGVIGESTASTAEDTLPKKYEAYNFIMSGSGTETMRLCWDADMFTPNAKEMNDLGVSDLTVLTTDTDGLTYADITLDASASGGRYDVQFYIKDESSRNAINNMTGWATMDQKIKLISVPAGEP